MKFIKEKLNVEHIIRRVHEEDAKSDRKVTEVLLTPAEWVEFVNTAPFRHSSPYALCGDKFEIAISEPLSLYPTAATTCYGPRRVTVRMG